MSWVINIWSPKSLNFVMMALLPMTSALSRLGGSFREVGEGSCIPHQHMPGWHPEGGSFLSWGDLGFVEGRVGSAG